MNRRARPTYGKGFGDGLAGRTARWPWAAYQQGWRTGLHQRRDCYEGLPAAWATWPYRALPTDEASHQSGLPVNSSAAGR